MIVTVLIASVAAFALAVLSALAWFGGGVLLPVFAVLFGLRVVVPMPVFAVLFGLRVVVPMLTWSQLCSNASHA
jgi:hypothetical protein